MNKKNALSLIALMLCMAMVFAFAACSDKGGETTGSDSDISDTTAANTSSDTTSADTTADYTGETKVRVTVKDYGEFIIELYPEYAPLTVANFLSHVKIGLYEGTIFHRVMDGFMAQGGEVTDGETPEPIKGEFASNGWNENTLSHTRGVISMARTNDFDSATSQFFICYSDDCTFLDGDYAAFGRVIEGMDVVDSFLEADRTYNSRGEKAIPLVDIVIEKMEIAG